MLAPPNASRYTVERIGETEDPAIQPWRIWGFLLAAPLVAQIANVSVTGVTNTQAILHYTAPDTSLCTVAVSTSPTFSPLVHDVDPAIFAGSNLDARSGNLTSGQERSFVIGKRAAEQGADGHWYSRALETLTDHYYSITCGAANATGSFTTANIALGNTYNEAMPSGFSGGYTSVGKYAWPEFLNWSSTDPAARQETVIDPQTGLSIKRWSMPMDLGNKFDHMFSAAISPTGAWTNPSNALADDTASTTFSGPGSDWLFLQDSQLTFNNGGLEALTFSVNGRCSGACAGDDAKIQACITVNKVSCWPTAANMFDLTLGRSASIVTYGDGSLGMQPWTPPGTPVLIAGDVTVKTGTVNVDASGNVSWASGAYFYPAWTAGSSVQIGSSTCTLSSMTGPVLMAIDPASCSPELTLPLSNASYSADNFGILVRKKTSSLDTISIQYAKYILNGSSMMEWPSGGGAKLCIGPTVTDPTTGHPGSYCVIGNTPQAYWTDSVTGDAVWVGIVNIGGRDGADGWPWQACLNWGTVGNALVNGQLQYYCTLASNSGKNIVVECSAPPTTTSGSFNPTCVNITPGAADLTALVAAFTAGQSPAFDPVQFNTGINIFARQNGRLLMSSMRGYQDTAAWLMVFDPNLTSTAPGCVGTGPGCIIAAQTTWAVAPCRWCTLHAPGWIGDADLMGIQGKYFGDWPGMPGGGFYSVQITSGALTATPGVAAGTGGCPAGGYGCDLVAVDGEPCNTSPAPAIGGHPAEPLNCPKNPAWSYLQDAAPGDVFNLSGEYVQLVSKNGSQWLLNRAYQSANPPSALSGTVMIPFCMATYGGWSHGATGLGWMWNYMADPHGLNANGDTITVSFPYDHETAQPTLAVGGDIWWDPNNHGLGYAISDGPGPGGLPNKWVSLGPAFAGSVGMTIYNEAAQEHPNYSQYSAPPAEQKWFLDSRTLTVPPPANLVQATLVGGQLYKFSSTTTDGDNLTQIGSASSVNMVNRKLQPTIAFCGDQPLVDVSSPVQGNTIATDFSSSNQYCEARNAGECRTGSAQGDLYLNCPWDIPGGNAWVSNTGAYLNGMSQIGFQDTYDPVGGNGRLLTHGLFHYRANDVNESGRVTPDGKWLLIEGFNFGTNYQILSGKLPPYPQPDGINRSTFVPMVLQLQPPASMGVDNAVVQFGYVENGPADQFYCTSRREACMVSAAAVGTVPFQFPSEGTDGTAGTLTGAPCSAGCTVAIPGLSQRMVYYQVLYRDANNQVVAQTRLQVTAVP
jgi:hypothetical protein